MDDSSKKNIRTDIDAGIGPKVTQSVITAAFLFAFKDALYAWTVSARRKVALKKA
jgi:adenine nucleotide transporter 17